MSELILKYQEASGAVTERRISSIEIENDETINAFCHLRNGRRSFKINRVMNLVDPSSGEIINPYECFASLNSKDGQLSIDYLTWPMISAIKALKFFSLTTRGFKQRERDRVTKFVQEISNTASHTPEELSEWVYKLWCGDIYRFRDGDTLEYTETLRNIPPSVLDRCRDYALHIASGSGRKPIEPAWQERIDTEFSSNPVVKPPIKPTSDGPCVTISVDLSDILKSNK
jgi:hypothetical protein